MEKSINQLFDSNDYPNELKNIDILIAPHHGRKSSFVKEFIEYLNPLYVIVSDKSLKEKEYNNISAVSDYSRIARKTNDGRNVYTTRKDGHILISISNSISIKNVEL